MALYGTERELRPQELSGVESAFKPPFDIKPIQNSNPLKPVQSFEPLNYTPALKPITEAGATTDGTKKFEFKKSMSLFDALNEAGKVQAGLNQGGYKQQLQPTFDYIQSQIPEISKQFMQKSFKQNVNPETGLGGQIAAKLLSDFQTNVLAPVLQQVGTQQALNAPKEQLQIAQNLKEQNQADIDRKIADLQNAIQSGQVKEDAVRPMLAQIYGVDESVLNAPETRDNVIDQYVQDAVLNQKRTPDLNELNMGLAALKLPQITQAEFEAKYGQAVKPEAGLSPAKISSLVSKLQAGQLDENTAAAYGIPYDTSYDLFKGGSWDWKDTPQTREKIKQLYATNPDFRSWFDFNA